MEDDTRQRKGKGVAGPFGVAEPDGDGESISPRTYRVNLGLASDEMDLIEGWVEHVMELFGEHEDPDSDPDSWACNQYHSNLSLVDIAKLREPYRVPEGVRLIFPSKADRPCSLPERYVAIMSDAFAILRSYNVCPYQVSPNFWTQAVGTWLIWQEVSPDYTMPLHVFHTLFKLNKCAKRDEEPAKGVKDWYYLTPKETHGPVITGHPSSIKH
ncbi:Uncharacterized protein Fot_42002 [Forsythia ovata]|uniref:Uncharacterized protein n=1 Tax=Forsythia ovata TaxID=205694 RepID=A0ABD1RJY6_9LAMI